jgi:hypothetical protein
MRKLLLGLGVAVLSQFAGPAWAVTVTSGVLEGDFSDVDYGANSSTAPATTFITNGASASTLQWGTGSVSYGTNYSTIEFIGATVPLEDTTEPVLLGSIVYLNGTSNTDSIISGATLTFSLGGVMLGHDQVIITSTTNLYSNMLDLTPAQAQNDADYVNVCGNGSNICSIGIQAFEDTEGFSGVPFSTPVVANLYGTYSIDPSITLTDATYVSGDGVVSGRPSGSVPEAPTWAMLLLGFAGIGFTARRWGARMRSPLTA